MTAVLLFFLHSAVIQVGGIAQPYGMCLLLAVAAFRLTVRAAEDRRPVWPLAAGFCATASALSLMLSGPMAPVFLGGLLRLNRSGERRAKCGWFLLGAAAALLPLLGLAAQGPRAVVFDLFEFHFFHRRVGVPVYTLERDLRELVNWLVSAQTLLLVTPAAVGLLALRAGRSLRCGAELRLCGWLVAAQAAGVAAAHPAFHLYLVVSLPFLIVLAVFGLYLIGTSLWTFGHPRWLGLLLAALFAVSPARWHYRARHRFDFRWSHNEEIARRVNEVTPERGVLFAPPAIYFASRRVPPPRLENVYARRVRVAPELASALRLASEEEVREWVAGGRFDTIVILEEHLWVQSLGLPGLYRRREVLHGFALYWERQKAP